MQTHANQRFLGVLRLIGVPATLSVTGLCAGSGQAFGAEGLLLRVIGDGAWVALLALAAVTLVNLAGIVPGSIGATARRLAAAVTPAVWRRALQASLGVGVLAGAVGAAPAAWAASPLGAAPAAWAASPVGAAPAAWAASPVGVAPAAWAASPVGAAPAAWAASPLGAAPAAWAASPLVSCSGPPATSSPVALAAPAGVGPVLGPAPAGVGPVVGPTPSPTGSPATLQIGPAPVAEPIQGTAPAPATALSCPTPGSSLPEAASTPTSASLLPAATRGPTSASSLPAATPSPASASLLPAATRGPTSASSLPAATPSPASASSLPAAILIPAAPPIGRPPEIAGPVGSSAPEQSVRPVGRHGKRRSVLVAPGDSLWSIAARWLGPDTAPAQIAETWPRWYATNRATIGPNPNLIFPGESLVPPIGG
ncbi:MAG: LysM peptidoglycan-binding domain-containing protein [Mycobacteriales bacterium]